MATDTVAPRAETAPLTAEILQLMPDDDWRYELMRGSPAHEERGFARLAPDLVVEVASPGQTGAQMEVKARLYLDAVVQVTWVVWPEPRTVDVWRAGEEAGTTVAEGDVLTGENVLPGLTISLNDIFA